MVLHGETAAAAAGPAPILTRFYLMLSARRRPGWGHRRRTGRARSCRRPTTSSASACCLTAALRRAGSGAPRWPAVAVRAARWRLDSAPSSLGWLRCATDMRDSRFTCRTQSLRHAADRRRRRLQPRRSTTARVICSTVRSSTANSISTRRASASRPRTTVAVSGIGPAARRVARTSGAVSVWSVWAPGRWSPMAGPAIPMAYELNPRVFALARSEFSFLANSRAALEDVPGDARLAMEREPPQRYDVLAIDAFSGGAIPVHLLTSEAIDVYLRHLNRAMACSPFTWYQPLPRPAAAAGRASQCKGPARRAGPRRCRRQPAAPHRLGIDQPRSHGAAAVCQRHRAGQADRRN